MNQEIKKPIGKSATNDELERTRFEFECERSKAEDGFRREEIELKREELSRSRWVNPLVIAVFAAAAAALGNAGITFISSYQKLKLEMEKATLNQKLNLEQSRTTLELEKTKSEAARILEVVKTNDPDKAAANLRFLIDTGLISDSGTRNQIQAYLDKRQPGQGIALPSPVSTNEPVGFSLELLSRLMQRPSREFLVASSANETIPVNSPFSTLFVAAIGGAADLYKHGVVSTFEIHRYMMERALQMGAGAPIPQLGRDPHPEFTEGQFFFRVLDASTRGRTAGAASDDPLRHGHALLIGNARYNDSRLPPLAPIQIHLRELASALGDHFDDVETVTDVNVGELRAKLDNFLRIKGSDKNARLFIYYAGHAYTEILRNVNEIRGYITGVDTPGVTEQVKVMMLRGKRQCR
jgi:hypothetical protein